MRPHKLDLLAQLTAKDKDNDALKLAASIAPMSRREYRAWLRSHAAELRRRPEAGKLRAMRRTFRGILTRADAGHLVPAPAAS